MYDELRIPCDGLGVPCGGFALFGVDLYGFVGILLENFGLSVFASASVFPPSDEAARLFIALLESFGRSVFASVSVFSPTDEAARLFIVFLLE